MNNTVIYVIIGAIGTACSIVFWLIGFNKGAQKESGEVGRDNGEFRANVEYIKRRVDEVLLEQKDTNKTISALSERVTRSEESIKSAWKRIEAIEGREPTK